MGWSCSIYAGETMKRMYEYCSRITHTGNGFIYKGRFRFIEISRREHDDGRITGSIWESVGNEDNPQCKKVDSLLIDWEGNLVRPRYLAKAMASSL